MTLLDGRPLAAAIRGEVAAAAAALPSRRCWQPSSRRTIPATAWYARLDREGGRRGRDRAAAGSASTTRRDAVRKRLKELSADDAVHAIICLTPLPEGLTLAEAGEHIAPRKDVDGASPASLGRLAAGLDAFAPATAQAVIELLAPLGDAARRGRGGRGRPLDGRRASRSRCSCSPSRRR